MASHYAVFALLLQVAIVYSNETIETLPAEDLQTEPVPTELVNDEPSNPFHVDTEENDYNVIEDPVAGPKDFYDLFFGSSGPYTNGQSVEMMEQATRDSTLPAEEQVALIKETADKIAACIQEELVSVLSYIITDNTKITDENENRKKRSADSPVDYSKMVMRLLNHLKSSNECQNIAIEKMMTAQEIADKFGINYTPEPDSLQELFDATEKKNNDIWAILNEYSGLENKTKDKTTEEVEPKDSVKTVDPMYYHYNVDEDVYEVEVPPQHLYPAPHCHYTFHPHCETQIRPPPVQQHHHQPVSQRPPAFYETLPAVTPVPQHNNNHLHQHQHHEEEIPEFAMFIEEIEAEPELTGEEYEETVSSKVTVDKGDQPETLSGEDNQKEDDDVSNENE